MWTRKELKQRGKQAFSLNYWKTVLIALLITALAGGASVFGGAGGSGGALAGGTSALVGEKQEEGEGNLDAFTEHPDGTVTMNPEELIEGLDQIEDETGASSVVFSIAIFVLFLVIFFVILAIVLVVNAFLLNPLEVGCRKFAITNLHTAAEVKEVAFGYDHCYKNIVKTLFFRDLYVVLWMFLFIIPGIIKLYSYRMIPYILAEDPGLPTKEAFERSKAMMRGQKWRAFILDLSFIGWDLLSGMTLGMLGIFYVNPYKQMTSAALYEAIAYGNRQEESLVWTES